ASALARATGGRVEAHDRFGTATLTLPGGDSLDVAVARRESYAHPGALPRVEAAPTVCEDLHRRGFPIPALAGGVGPRRGASPPRPAGRMRGSRSTAARHSASGLLSGRSHACFSPGALWPSAGIHCGRRDSRGARTSGRAGRLRPSLGPTIAARARASLVGG